MRYIMLDSSSYSEINFFEEQLRQMNIFDSISLIPLGTVRIKDVDILIISDLTLINDYNIYDIPIIISCSSKLPVSSFKEFPKPLFLFTDFSKVEFSEVLSSVLRFNQFHKYSNNGVLDVDGLNVRTILKKLEQSSVETTLLNSKLESILNIVASSIKELKNRIDKSNEDILDDVWFGVINAITNLRNFSLDIISVTKPKSNNFSDFITDALNLYREISKKPLNYIFNTQLSKPIQFTKLPSDFMASTQLFLFILEDYFQVKNPLELKLLKESSLDSKYIEIDIIGKTTKRVNGLKEKVEKIFKHNLTEIKIISSNLVTLHIKLNNDFLKPKKSTIKSNIKNYSIALVDDEPIIRNALESLLENDNITITSFESSEKLLKYIENYSTNPFSIYLLDIIMPGMTGDQLYLELNRKFGQVKALFLSGFSDEASIHRVLDDGVSGFLCKPVRKYKLYEQIAKLLEVDIDNFKKPTLYADDNVISPKSIIIDKVYGLRMLDGNEKLYNKVCEDLIHKYSDCADKIELLIDDLDFNNGRIFAHSLKSIVGMVGGFGFQESCKQLEYSFKGKDIKLINSAFDLFKENKILFFNALEIISPNMSKEEHLSLDIVFKPSNEFITELKDLESFLSHSEINSAIIEIDRLKENMNNEQEIQFLTQIKYYLDNFNIEKAIQKLSGLVVE